MQEEIQNNPSTPSTPAPAVPVEKTGVTPGAPEASEANKVPAANPSQAADGSNVQPSHTDVLEKRFKDMERKFQSAARERATFLKERESLTQQLSHMQKALEQLTKKPIDPAQFIRDLETKGPEVLNPLFEERFKAREEGWAKEKQELQNSLEELRLRHAIADRRSDAEKYPDFRKLEATMTEIYTGEYPPEMEGKSLDEQLDWLYEQAKLRHSQDAIAAAEKAGEQKAVKQLAKEASTAVAGGGKSAGAAVPDFKDPSWTTKKMREYYASQGMIADRD